MIRQCVSVLRAGDFRRLWLGSTVSLIGDGMTFVALSWLVLAQTDGVSRLGLLGVCYTAPVVLGGLAVGPLLDRFDKRAVLIADSLFRAVAVATIPLTAAAGIMPDWLPFAVAAIYGLLKMVPLAGFPSAIPALVRETDLNAANALESLSFSLASMIGPASAGVLISWIGPAGVLAIDATSFLVFALTAALVRRPLRPARQAAALAPLRRLGRDRVIIATTVAFMAFNIAEGMLLITAPWLAKHELLGGAATLGALLAAPHAGIPRSDYVDDFASTRLGISLFDAMKGGDPPADPCPECGQHLVLWFDFDTGGRRPDPWGRCFFCECEFNDRCPICNDPVNNPYIADESMICADCMDDIRNED